MPYIKVCHRSHCTNMENTFEEIKNIERHTNTLKQRSFKKPAVGHGHTNQKALCT